MLSTGKPNKFIETSFHGTLYIAALIWNSENFTRIGMLTMLSYYSISIVEDEWATLKSFNFLRAFDIW